MLCMDNCPALKSLLFPFRRLHEVMISYLVNELDFSPHLNVREIADVSPEHQLSGIFVPYLCYALKFEIIHFLQQHLKIK